MLQDTNITCNRCRSYHSIYSPCEVVTRRWNGISIVLISSVSTIVNNETFASWLYGQTLPFVEDDKEPTGWAYSWDYARFINRKGIID